MSNLSYNLTVTSLYKTMWHVFVILFSKLFCSFSLLTYLLVRVVLREMMSLQKYLCVLFGCFLCWKCVAAFLYVTRAITCCVQERKVSFLCRNYTGYPDSLELEFAWITSHVFAQIISLVVVTNSTAFLGYRVLTRKLIHIPNYLSLVFIMVLTFVGHVTIFALHSKTTLETIILITFMAKSILSVILIGVSNLTQLQLINPQSKVFCFVYKLTILGFFLDNALVAVVGMVQFAFKVNGLDRNKHSTSSEFHILFSVLRRFTQLVFYYRLSDFYWQKLFMDGNNILSYNQSIGQPEHVMMGQDTYQAII